MGRNEIIIIALVVVLLFGAPKLPQFARSIGKSMRILKDETRSLTDDNKSRGAHNGEREDEQAVDDGVADNRDPGNRGFDRPDSRHNGFGHNGSGHNGSGHNRSGDDGRAHN